MHEMSLNAPRGRGLMIVTAHPEGCRVLADQMIQKARSAFPKPLAAAEGKTVLVFGNTSLGYGLNTSIPLKEAGCERIIGIGFEPPPVIRGDKVSSTSGLYLTPALHAAYPTQRTYLADAFSDDTKDRVIRDLKKEGVKIDLVLYSVAAPRRTYRGQTWNSSLKILGKEPLDVKGLTYSKGLIEETRLEPGTEVDAENTRRVMGGEDLDLWMSALLYADLLNVGATVASLSYIGPDFGPLRRIYWDGTIGFAKKDIDATTRRLNARLAREVEGKAFTAMYPAAVTTASVAIPAIVKYLSDYQGAAKAGLGVYLNPIEVGIKFAKMLYGDGAPWKENLDSEGRLRLDQEELDPGLQAALQEHWERSKPGELEGITAPGFEEFQKLYHRLFGFQVEGVDYNGTYDFDPALTPEMGVINLIG